MKVTLPYTISAMIIVLSRFSRVVSGFGVSTFVPKKTPAQTIGRLRHPDRVPSSCLNVLAEPISTVHSANDDILLEPLIICGPSGVGKGTVIAKYMEQFGGTSDFDFTVSHTTRAPRPGEVDGMHYNFVEIEAMKAAIANAEFLETAEVHGNLYGTSWESMRSIQRRGKRALLDIDVQGVKNIKEIESLSLKPKYVFIAPPSMDVLAERLVGRGTESPESLARRTANARAEVEYGFSEGNFDAIVVNNDLEASTKEFAKVIQDLYEL